jgi:hypothetical protein
MWVAGSLARHGRLPLSGLEARARQDERAGTRRTLDADCDRVRDRNGKVTRLISYWDCHLAFADVGLTPGGDLSA